jgi:hypothetical protein
MNADNGTDERGSIPARAVAPCASAVILSRTCCHPEPQAKDLGSSRADACLAHVQAPLPDSG